MVYISVAGVLNKKGHRRRCLNYLFRNRLSPNCFGRCPFLKGEHRTEETDGVSCYVFDSLDFAIIPSKDTANATLSALSYSGQVFLVWYRLIQTVQYQRTLLRGGCEAS